jgi:hypothetical protein
VEAWVFDSQGLRHERRVAAIQGDVRRYLAARQPARFCTAHAVHACGVWMCMGRGRCRTSVLWLDRASSYGCYFLQPVALTPRTPTDAAMVIHVLKGALAMQVSAC